jgi:hypothetical protein
MGWRRRAATKPEEASSGGGEAPWHWRATMVETKDRGGTTYQGGKRRLTGALEQ